MAVKWIGAAAKELGLSPWDAVEALALQGEYPWNGLVDEDRYRSLKLARDERQKAVETSGARRRELSGAGVPPVLQEPGSVTSVTEPLPQMPDRAEERTVILPPVGPPR